MSPRRQVVDVPVPTVPDLDRQLDELAGICIGREKELHWHDRTSEVPDRHQGRAVGRLFRGFDRLVERRRREEEAAPEPGKVPAGDLLDRAEKVRGLRMLEGPPLRV